MKYKLPPAVGRTFALAAVCWLALGGAPLMSASAQQLGPYDRDSARDMLRAVREDLQKNYYDPALRGMNVEARFQQAEERIKQAQTRDQLIVAVAQVMLDLNDSHTYFLPPFRAARVTYGWKSRMVGDQCFVTHVNPKSDAAAKGLKAGDAVLSVDGFRPTRDNLWKMYYRYYVLMPARSQRLVVQSPGGERRELEVMSKIEKTAAVAQFFTNIYRYDSETKIEQHGFLELGDVIVWRLPTFDDSPDHIDDLMNRVRKFKTLVLDLRGNGGGAVVTLERLVGNFFDRDLKVADTKSRKEAKPSTAKTRGGDKVFKGQLVVLVDSESGSASEIFARIVQLEKRGKVLGDRTAGAVMTSRGYDHQTGVGSVLYYGTSVTIADVIMPDGQSLEGVGVTPDELLLPSAADIAAGHDTVLSRAVEMVGGQLAPEKAARLSTVEWMK